MFLINIFIPPFFPLSSSSFGSKMLKKRKLIILLFAILFKYSISLGGYSGFNIPPIFGDFEAQRHWLEITSNLPLQEWYSHDLEYWGLDYPPLTAYHSILLGYIAKMIDPNFVKLYTSRGLESIPLKLFMRLTALGSDLFILVPAIYVFDANEQQILMLMLMPGLQLIDHGHFQYNSVMLGFSLFAFTLLKRGDYIIGSIMFVLALFFKQMALFYALPVFFYLLACCRKQGYGLLVKLGLTVIGTTIIIVSPFVLTGGLESVMQIVHRVFPVARGLYEDKVANVWCALSVVVKLRSIFDLNQLMKLRY
jgi:alpha-1,3-glucosyltransferase